MALGLYGALWTVKHPLEKMDAYVLVAVFLILLKLALIVALAMLFSCFTTPFLAILFTAGIYVAGDVAARFGGNEGGKAGRCNGQIPSYDFLCLTRILRISTLWAQCLTGEEYLAGWCGYATLYAILYGAIILSNRLGDILAAESEMMSRTARGMVLGVFVIAGMAGVWGLRRIRCAPSPCSSRVKN